MADPQHDAAETRLGLLFAVAAFGAWGVVPLFWKQLGAVSSDQLVAHRVVWSALILSLLVLRRGLGGQVRAVFSHPGTLRWFALSAVLIGTNWFTYLYAVATDRIVDASLGYFINPLVNVVLGRLVLGEQLRRLQLVALALATAGVGLMAYAAGGVPWIALVLSASFGSYGLVRKQAPAGALAGSVVEQVLLVPVALGYLVWLASQGSGALGQVDAWTTVLLMGTGVVTAFPLLWFSEAARRLPLSTVAFAQYLSPTGQFLLGVFVYHEPFGVERLVAFSFIWAGLGVFTYQLWRRTRGR